MTEDLVSKAKPDDDIIYCGCGPKLAINGDLTLLREPKFCECCGKEPKTRCSKVEGILVSLELGRIAVVDLSDFQDMLKGKDVEYVVRSFYGD